jgi:quercetin dioxygenase-like cupin family protein
MFVPRGSTNGSLRHGPVPTTIEPQGGYTMTTRQLLRAALSIDVDAQIRILRATPEGKAGAALMTVVRHPDFRVHLITLREGLRIGWHSNPGRVSVECAAGLVRIHTAHRHYDLPAGEALALCSGVGHDAEALRDSAFIVTIARPEADVPALFGDSRWVLPSRESAAQQSMHRSPDLVRPAGFEPAAFSSGG